MAVVSLINTQRSMSEKSPKNQRMINGGSHDCYPGFDLFARKLHLNFPSGRDKFETCSGIFFSFCFMITLVTVFASYAIIEWDHITGDEKELASRDYFRLIVRLAVDLAGLALFLYAIGWALTRCLTKNQMENYLVSEMFSHKLEKPENK